MSKIYQFLINRNPELMSSDYETYGYRDTLPSMNELITSIRDIAPSFVPTNIIYKEILKDDNGDYDVTIKIEFDNNPDHYWNILFSKIYVESW